MSAAYTATDRAYINPETLSLYCNTNAHLLSAPPRAFVLEFPGLGGGSCLGGCMDRGPYNAVFAPFLAEQGILLAYTFPGPWSWMNRGAIRLVDALADALREAYGFTADTPWAVMGGSMGGLGALIYTAAGKHTPTACLSVCPCVDVPDRFDCHPDFPRTLLRAVADYEMPFDEALKTLSPRHRLADMPHIPYHLVCDCADEVFPEAQLDDYAAALRALGHDVCYDKLPDCRHGELTAEECERIKAFLTAHLVGR